MTISEKIFEILAEKKISQKAFSKATGIPESTISDWKKKGNTPGADKIMLICKALGVSPYELLGDEGVDCFTVDKGTIEGQMLEIYSNLGDANKNRMLGYALALSEKVL